MSVIYKIQWNKKEDKVTQNDKRKEEVKVNSCGILLRGYAKSRSEVKDVADRLNLSAKRASEIGFRNIAILISEEKDCGSTLIATCMKLDGLGLKAPRMRVASIEGNDKDILNDGLRYLWSSFCEYAFIASNKAVGYLNTPNIEKILATFSDGALCSGLALRNTSVPQEEDQIYNGVLAGRISNILAAWDIKALDAVGGFDSEIGSEEIAPIIRLIKKYSKCIAPVIPTEDVGLNVSSLRAEHFASLSSTKTGRQFREASRAKGSFQLIEDGIILGYPE